MPLTPEQIAAAQGMFSAPAPVASQVTSGMPLAPGSDAASMPQVGISPEQVAAAQSMFQGPPPQMNPALDAPALAPQAWRAPMALPPGEMPSAAMAPAPAPMADPRAAAPQGGGTDPRAQLRQAQGDEIAAYDRTASAMRDENSAEQRKAEAVGTLQSAEALRGEEQAKIQRDAYKQVEDTHNEFIQKTQAMLTAVEQERIDPNRLFANKGAAEKMTYILGAALAGFAQARLGGSNVVLDGLDHLINQDIAAQKANLENKREVIRGRESLYGQLRQQLGDVKAADAAYGLLITQAAENRIKAMSSTMDSPVMAARLEQGLAAIGQQKAKRTEEMAQASIQRATAMAQATAAARQKAVEDARKESQREFDNVYKLRELDIKRADAETKRLEAGKKSGDSTDARRVGYAQDLEKAGIPQAQATLEELRNRLPSREVKREDGSVLRVPDVTKDVPGFTTGSKVANWLSELPQGLPGGDAVHAVAQRVLLSDEARLNRQDVQRLALAYKNQVTGSGGSDREAEDIYKAFMGAGSKEELWNTLNQAQSVIDSRKGNLQSGYGPEVVQSYEQNKSGSAFPNVTFKPGLNK